MRLRWWRNVVEPLLALTSGQAPVSDQVATSQGWTDFTKTVTGPKLTRVIYVAAQPDGDNANCGYAPALGYNNANCPGNLGLDPNPHSGQHGPKLTCTGAQGGRAKLRDGYPDWLLIRCGDTFTNQNISGNGWDLSGLDDNNRMLVSSYIGQTGFTSPPKFIVPTSQYGFWAPSNMTHNHITLANIEFVAAAWTEDYAAVGWFDGANFTVEGCKASIFHTGISVVVGSNVTVRRNVIHDTARNGMYLGGFDDGGIDGLTVEENVVYRTTNATFTNNWVLIYIDWMNTDVTANRNVLSGPCSVGLLARGGGDLSDNVVMKCGRGLSLGGRDGANQGVVGGVTVNATINCVINGKATGSYQEGIDLENILEATVSSNILSWFESGTSPMGVRCSIAFAFAGLSNMIDTTIERNIIYNWTVTADGYPIYVQNDPLVGTLTGMSIANNDIANLVHPTDPLIIVRDDDDMGEITSAGNRFFSVELPAPPSDTWFEFGLGVTKSLAQWKAATGPDTTSTVFDPNTAYPASHTKATIEGYAEAIGIQQPTHAQFVVELLKQHRYAWRPDLGATAINNYIRACFGR